MGDIPIRPASLANRPRENTTAPSSIRLKASGVMPSSSLPVYADMVANIRAMTAAPRASSPCSVRTESLEAAAWR